MDILTNYTVRLLTNYYLLLKYTLKNIL